MKEYIFQNFEKNTINKKGNFQSSGLLSLQPGIYRFTTKYRIIENPNNNPNLVEIMIANWKILKVFRGVNIPGKIDAVKNDNLETAQIDLKLSEITDLEYRITLLDAGEIVVNEIKIFEKSTIAKVTRIVNDFWRKIGLYVYAFLNVERASCLFIIPDREAPLNCAHVGISSIASYIYEYGRFNSQGINTCLFSDAEIKELIQKNQYEYIFITMITGQHEHVISISKLIKSVDSKIKIVIGGPYIAITKYEMLEKSSDIDYLIVGEGEKTALELLEKSPLAGIKGLIFRDENGAIIENPERPFTENLDEFPAPKLDIYLRTNWLEYPIITSRGCVYKCNFCCASKIWGHKLRFRSIESIEKEVFQIIKIMGKNDYIIISDDFFNFKKERTLKLCDIFKKLGIKYFVRGIRADKVDSDIAMALKDSGCFGCGVGVESVDNSSLKMMNKNVRFDEIERGCKFLMENGISICGQFIIGNIGDTLETVKKSIEFGKKINVASFYPLYVLPGTELEDYVKKNKLLLPEPYKVEGLKGRKKEAYIFLETEIFPLDDRIKAIHLADEAGFLT